MKYTLPEGIPTKPLTKYEERDLAIKIQAKGREEDINELAMHSVCEAMPYLYTVSKAQVPQDELLSMVYEGLRHAACNFKPGRIRFFRYAKVYLRSVLSKWWKSQDIVRNSSRFEDKDAPEEETYVNEGSIRNREWKEPAFDSVELREQWEVVQPLLKKKLTERERMVVEMVYLGGFTFTRISKLIVPPVTREAIRICHVRAMRKLRLALDEINGTL